MTDRLHFEIKICISVGGKGKSKERDAQELCAFAGKGGTAGLPTEGQSLGSGRGLEPLTTCLGGLHFWFAVTVLPWY